MRNATLTVVGFAGVLLAGCTPFVEVVRVSPEETASLKSEVRVYESDELRKVTYSSAGSLEATSCQLLITDPAASDEDAINQLKYKARLLGANGISNISCSKGGLSFTKNCWSYIVCRADAIRVTGGQ